MLGVRLGFVLSGRVLAGIAVLLMCAASFIFTLSVSAHDMDTEQARTKVRQYAREVLNDGSGYNYYETRCTKQFPHRVNCRVFYQKPEDRAIGEWTCREDITVYFQAHRGNNRNWEYYMTHVSPQAKCGKRTLTGPQP